MATFKLTGPDGGTYNVDAPDEAAALSAFHSLVGSAPAEPTTVNNVGRSFATGVPVIGGLLNKADAATNAALAPVLNPLFSEKDQLSEPTWSERYAHSLRDQEGSDQRFATQHPVIDTSAKLAGGVAAMVPAVAAAPGLLGATGGLGARVGMGGLSNALIGGADSAVRGNGPVSGALLGGALGAAAPIAESVASPFISGILGRFNSEAYAERQVARGIGEGGQSPDQLANAMTQAAREGQPQFTLADAMGNAGQRLLSTTARAPGQGRTDVVNALEARQAGQGRRISNALAEGFDSPQTAAQTEARLTGARDTAADAEYGAVRNDAQPVDVTGAIQAIDRTISPATAFGTNIAPDSAEAALQAVRSRLTDGRSNLTSFEAVQRVRGDLSDAVQAAVRGGAGNKARLLGGVLRQLDSAMENASAGHLAANRNFAQASRDIEAVQTGRDAFLRGRTEDTIPAFNALQPRGQQAFRAGYVDPAIAQTQGAAFGVNKARPLINDAFQQEADAMAPGNPLMQRRIGREQTMFETRAQALGGSKTADNLHDAAALAVNPTLVGHVVSGNWTAAIGSMLHSTANVATGNTPAVRKAVADILLRNGANLTAPQLNQMVSRTISQIQFLQTLARSGVGAATVAPSATAKKPRQTPIFAR
jgi:hypothetical protein